MVAVTGQTLPGRTHHRPSWQEYYVRKEESPSSNTKNGVTDGVREPGKAGITARPEGLSEGGNPSATSAEPTPLFNNIISNSAAEVNQTHIVYHLYQKIIHPIKRQTFGFVLFMGRVVSFPA